MIGACQILEEAGFAGAIGIVDADFDHIEAKASSLKTVFRTDLHDAECMILSGVAFQKVLDQFASGPKLEAWSKLFGSDVRNCLLSETAKIGCLLWWSLSEDANLVFTELDYGAFVDAKTYSINLSRFVTHVKNKSNRHDLVTATLVGAIEGRIAKGHSPWHLARGHDITDFLGYLCGSHWVIGPRKRCLKRSSTVASGWRIPNTNSLIHCSLNVFVPGRFQRATVFFGRQTLFEFHGSWESGSTLGISTNS